MQTKTKKGNNLLVEILILICLVLLAAALYYIYSSRKTTTKITPTQSPTTQISEMPAPSETPIPPTPTPTALPLPHGKQSFSISQGSAITGPKFVRFIIDPMDPSVGAKQMLEVETKDTAPVQKVVASVKTDNKTYPDVELKKVGTNGANDVWQGTWTIDDTILHTYVVNVKATSASGVNSLDLVTR